MRPATWRRWWAPAALESDREARRLRIRRLAEQAYITLPAADRAALAAYARGVNAFIDSHLGNLPLEFTLLGYQPRPWSAVDSLIVSLHMFRTLTTSWRDDILKSSMLAQGDARKVNFLFPVRTGAEPQPGSNAWALAGSRTASGKPLLSNDPHLEYSLPGIWYMTHLQAPGMDAVGVTVPGLPGIVIGHNQRIAWGMTNLEFDVQDLYIEKLDDRTGRYLFRGQVEQARREIEVIRVKGQRPVELPIWVTRHGPIFAAEGNQRLALRWIAADAGIMQYPVLDIDRAQNWQQFTAALTRYPGPGAEFRVCRRRRQHRLPCRRPAAGAPWICWRRAGGWRFRQFRMGWHHPLRAASLGLQSAQRHDRHRQPEPVSGGLSLYGQWRFRAALPRQPDPLPSFRAQELAGGGHAGRSDRTFIPPSESFWPANWWPPTTADTSGIRGWKTL